MLFSISKKSIFLLLSIAIALFLTNFVLAGELEVIYPEIMGETMTTKPLLPEYIKYIFNVALTMGGLVAFGAVIYGGIRYLTSVGSPSAADDAKNQIVSGILGLIILLSSFIILNTVNPNLVILKLDKKPSNEGVILNPGGNQEQITLSVSDLQSAYGADFELTDINILSLPAILTVSVCSGTGFTEPCKETAGGAVPITNPKSIKLDWKIPGVTLFAETDFKGERVLYRNSVGNLKSFNDKASSIKFTSGGDENSYGAILLKDANWKGD